VPTSLIFLQIIAIATICTLTLRMKSPSPSSQNTTHRHTLQRQIILDAVAECGGHCSPDDIYARIQAAAPAISRSTVYRTLDFFARGGLVTAADMGNGMVYEIARENPHHHLICRTCGAKIELSHEPVQALFNKIEKQTGFCADSNHIVLWGICKACNSQS